MFSLVWRLSMNTLTPEQRFQNVLKERSIAKDPNQSIRHCAPAIVYVPIHFMENFAERSWFGCLQNPTHARIESTRSHQARRKFGEWAQKEIAVDPDFHKQISFSDEAQFLLNG